MKSNFLHLFVALIAVIATLFGYGFWYAAVVAKSAAVADLKGQIDAKTEATSRTAFARAALAEIAGGEFVVQDYFVPETGVVVFIDGLEERGKAQGADVSVLSVSKSTINTRPTFTFSLVIAGTFDAVMRTIGTIEYAPYDLSVSTLSLGQDDKNSWHANLNLLVVSVNKNNATSTP